MFISLIQMHININKLNIFNVQRAIKHTISNQYENRCNDNRNQQIMLIHKK